MQPARTGWEEGSSRVNLAHQIGRRARSTRKMWPEEPLATQDPTPILGAHPGRQHDSAESSRSAKSPAERGFYNAPGEIRTPDLRFRRPTLYPAELRALTVQRTPTIVASRRRSTPEATDRHGSSITSAQHGWTARLSRPAIRPTAARRGAGRGSGRRRPAHEATVPTHGGS